MGLASMGSSMPVLTRVSRTLVTQPAVPVGPRGAPCPMVVLKLHPGGQSYRHFPVFRQSATGAAPLPSVASTGAGVQASAPWQPSSCSPMAVGLRPGVPWGGGAGEEEWPPLPRPRADKHLAFSLLFLLPGAGCWGSPTLRLLTVREPMPGTGRATADDM